MNYTTRGMKNKTYWLQGVYSCKNLGISYFLCPSLSRSPPRVTQIPGPPKHVVTDLQKKTPDKAENCHFAPRNQNAWYLAEGFVPHRHGGRLDLLSTGLRSVSDAFLCRQCGQI